MEKDPFELYPLHNTQIIVQDIMNKVLEIVDKHIKTIVEVPEQLGNFSRDLIPCCNPPHCSCDNLNRDLTELVSKRAKNINNLQQQQMFENDDSKPPMIYLLSELKHQVFNFKKKLNIILE